MTNITRVLNPDITMTGSFSPEDIEKYTKGLRQGESGKLSEHDVGRIGEEIARDIILPRIPNVMNIRKRDQIGLEKARGVPFDIVANMGNRLWLVEIKTSQTDSEGGVSPTQKHRMKKSIELLNKAGISSRPILIHINLKNCEFRIDEFPFEIRVGKEADYVKIIEKTVIFYKAIPSLDTYLNPFSKRST